jgi:tRNA splicing endonuclease
VGAQLAASQEGLSSMSDVDDKQFSWNELPSRDTHIIMDLRETGWVVRTGFIWLKTDTCV